MYINKWNVGPDVLNFQGGLIRTVHTYIYALLDRGGRVNYGCFLSPFFLPPDKTASHTCGHIYVYGFGICYFLKRCARFWSLVFTLGIACHRRRSLQETKRQMHNVLLLFFPLSRHILYIA